MKIYGSNDQNISTSQVSFISLCCHNNNNHLESYTNLAKHKFLKLMTQKEHTSVDEAWSHTWNFASHRIAGLNFLVECPKHASGRNMRCSWCAYPWPRIVGAEEADHGQNNIADVVW